MDRLTNRQIRLILTILLCLTFPFIFSAKSINCAGQPIIVTQPKNLSQCVGTNAIFSVEASGTDLKYQWRKGGVNILGATSPNYTINSIVAESAGTYDVIVSNDLGTVTSGAATLIVNKATSIVSQPMSLSQGAGSTAIFYVAASGAELLYQWRKAGVNILGAVTDRYTINSITSSNSGSYNVLITGACGTVTSNTVSLNVQASGTPAIPFGFKITPLSAAVNLSWIDGADNEDGFIIERAVNSSTNYNEIARVAANSTSFIDSNLPEGTYKYRICSFNSYGKSSYTGVLYYGNRMLNIDLTEGGIVSTSVGDSPAGGEKDKAFDNNCMTKWLIKSKTAWIQYDFANDLSYIVNAYSITSANDLSSRDPKSFILQGSNDGIVWSDLNSQTNISFPDRFFTQRFTFENTAAYKLYRLSIIANSGDSYIQIAELQLETSSELPAIIVQPANIYQCSGSGTFSVEALGSNLSYQWRKNGVNISGENSASYTINSITAESVGNYDVIVTGQGGSITSSSASIVMNSTPTITSQPVSQSLPAGASATLNVVASGQNLKYQWRRDKLYIKDALSSSYTLSSLSYPYAVSYDVLVTGSCGVTTSDKATLSIQSTDIRDAYSIIQAERMDGQKGVTVYSIGFGDFHPGDWARYDRVNFGFGADSMGIAVGSTSSVNRKIEVRLDSPFGAIIGTLSIVSTGATTNYREQIIPIRGATGIRSVYLVGSGLAAGNVDWFKFYRSGTSQIIAPSELSAVALSDTALKITWLDNSEDETGFKIEQRRSDGIWTYLVTSDANANSFIINGVLPGTKYLYRVKAFNDNDTSAYSNEFQITTPSRPHEPSVLTATLITGNSIKLSWVDNSNNESGFKLERKSEAGDFSVLTTLTADTTIYLNTGLLPGTSYTYRVSAYNSFGNSDYSNEINIKTPTIPEAPLGFTATALKNQVNLSWSDNVNEAGYIIEYKDGVSGLWLQLTDLPADVISFTAQGAVPGKTYYYRVYAYNLAGNSSYSAEVSVSIPIPLVSPENLNGIVVSGTEIRLNWDDLSTNEDGYKIEINSGSGYTLKSTVPANVKALSCTGLSNGVTYSFRVFAYKGTGVSGYSNEIYLTTPFKPLTPSDLKLTVLDSRKVVLSWKDNSNNEERFKISRSTIAGEVYYFTTASNVNSFIDSIGDKHGVLYTYNISAENKAGASDYITKSVVPFNGEVHAPLNLKTAYFPNSKKIRLEWITDADYIDTVYLERKTGSGNFEEIIKFKGYLYYEDFNIVENQIYSYRIRNSYGGRYSLYSSEVSQEAKDVVITNLAATCTNGGQIYLTWNFNPNFNFILYKKINSGIFIPVEYPLLKGDGYILVDNCPVGSTYEFQLIDSNGSKSNIVSIVNSGFNTPKVPYFSEAAISQGNLVVAWSDKSDNEDGFIIEYSKENGEFTELARVLANVYIYRVPNALDLNVSYFFRLKSYNSYGSSISVTKRLKVLNSDYIPPAPQGIRAQLISNSRIKLSWMHIPKFKEYVIERRIGAGSFTAIGSTINSYFYDETYGGVPLVAYRIYAYENYVNNRSEYSSEAITGYTTNGPQNTPQVSVNLVSSNESQISWTYNSFNEDGFQIIRNNNGNTSCLATINKDQRSYKDNTIESGNTYTYYVYPYNITGKNVFGSEYVSVPGSLPVAPSNLVSLIGSCTQINLQWTDNANNEAGFILERSTNSGAYVEISSLIKNTSSYSDVNLIPGTTYRYRVRAFNVIGSSAYVETTRATPAIPAVPSSLVAITASNTQINLSWTDQSSNEENFRVERKVGNGVYSELATCAPNISSYASTGLTSGVSYSYKVRVYAYGCYSNYSNEVITTPILAPVTLTVQTISSSQISLTWVDKSTNEDGFRIERKIGNDAFVEVATVAANITTFNSKELLSGTFYAYRVTAYNSGGNSAYTNEAGSKTLLSAPTNLLATPISDKQINLSWTDNAPNETGYTIEQQTGTGSFTEIASLGANVTSYYSINLASKTSYNFRVKAISSGNSSEYSNTANATTFYLPKAPGNLEAYPTSESEIGISWYDRADNEAGYILECKTGNGAFVEIANLSPNIKSFDHKGLLREINYTYRIKAYNNVGSSSYSEEFTANIPLPPPAPTNVKARIIAGNDIEITWDDNASDEVFYLIYLDELLHSFTQANNSSFVIRNLPTKIYRIWITTFTSIYQISSEPISINLYPTPAAPTLLSHSVNGNQVILNWTDNSTNETGFSIEKSSDNINFAELATVSANTTTYKTLPLGSGKNYKFRVRSLGTGLASDPTNEVAVNFKSPNAILATSVDYNYVQTIIFDENEEIIGQSVNYSDELGRSIQSLSQDVASRKIIGSQVIYDAFGRPAISTLPVAYTATDIKYQADFVTDPDNTPYDYTNFDKTGEPDAISGKLANYYSNANQEETNVPSSAYPYTRTDYSKITGAARKSAIAGEAHRLGSGHETQSYSMSVPEAEMIDYATSATIGFGSLRSLDSETDADVKLEYKGLIKTITIDADGKTSVTYSSEGKVVAACMADDAASSRSVSAPVNTGFNYHDIHLSSTTSLVTINTSVTYQVYDLATDLQVGTSYTGSVALGKGVYRIVFTGAVPAGTTVTYPVKYTDHSFSMYDEAGRLVYSISPKSYQEWVAETSKTIANFKSTYASWNKYNSLGFLLESSSPDEGKSTFVYRRDGKIRFSQNAQQAADKKFSYTNYDYIGRACESGEYAIPVSNPDFYTDQFDADSENNIVESIFLFDDLTADGLNDVNCLSQTFTWYDNPEESVMPGYSQHYTYGAVTKVVKGASATWYSYTYDGRTEWVVQQLPDINKKSIDYEYNFEGQTIKVTMQKGKKDEFLHRYEYDSNGRLEYVYTRGNTDLNEKLRAHYLYYAHGPLKRTEYGGKLQGIDYIYTINGWLKSINDPHVGAVDGSQLPYDPGADGFTGVNSIFGKDVFGMSLDYFSNDYASKGSRIISVPATACYNGNIAASRWGIFKDNANVQSGAYQYTYDRRNWLTNAAFGSINSSNQFVKDPNERFRENISYDLNGNITNILRDAPTLYENVRFDYAPKSNKLVRNTSPLLDQDYSYNSIGQTIGISYTDRNVPGTEIRNRYFTYDVYGNVTEIRSDAGKPLVINHYDATGFRVKKEDYTYSGTDVTVKKTWYLRDASGNILAVYNDDYNELVEQYLYGAARFGAALANSYGEVEKYAYDLTDHLGNVRATITADGNDTNTEPDVLAYTDYYPFGMEMRSFTSWRNRFGYQGQYAEKDPETGYNHFEARDYDPRIGRWLVPDPAGQYWSPYLGMGNNPVLFADKDGEWINVVVGLVVGAVTEIASQTFTLGMENMSNGRGFFSGWGRSIDWADVAISGAEGMAISCGVPPNIARTVGGLGRSSVSWNGEGLKHAWSDGKGWKGTKNFLIDMAGEAFPFAYADITKKYNVTGKIFERIGGELFLASPGFLLEGTINWSVNLIFKRDTYVNPFNFTPAHGGKFLLQNEKTGETWYYYNYKVVNYKKMNVLDEVVVVGRKN